MSERIPLRVPQLGVVEEVLVLEWLQESGAAVMTGAPVVVIETEKAEMELEAPADGLLEIVIEAKDIEVPVGAVLAYVVTS
jgi:pyruvate/2-oxoglutarate dehydrogenase complex dihydrolipoamide acyltransferase (E2) component